MIAGMYTITQMNALTNQVMDDSFDVATEAPEVINREAHILQMSKMLRCWSDILTIGYNCSFTLLVLYRMFTETTDIGLLVAGIIIALILFLMRIKSQHDIKESFCDFSNQVESKFGSDLYSVWKKSRNKE